MAPTAGADVAKQGKQIWLSVCNIAISMNVPLGTVSIYLCMGLIRKKVQFRYIVGELLMRRLSSSKNSMDCASHAIT